MIIQETRAYKHLNVNVSLSRFRSSAGRTEWHAMLTLDANTERSDTDQVKALLDAQSLLTDQLGANVLFGRMMVKDGIGCAAENLSCIGQAPLDGTAAALWLWLEDKADNGCRHIFGSNYVATVSDDGAPLSDSESQSRALLVKYNNDLKDKGLNLADNCLRTWFFVRDIDKNYHGLVVARREYFDDNGLTRDTHYVASTGINGNPADCEALVQLDTYTVSGLDLSRITYLKGSSHLNPTAEYGVTFERATKVQFDDRNMILISGTASIDNHGQILYPDDAQQQARRMLENIEVLVNEGGAQMSDLMHGIVYLRNAADYMKVRNVIDSALPALPKVYVLAPVCRPGWLVEMECIAMTE
ncbi:MAG: hypothetical protein KBT20_03295 [Bacteroidales bacterium]|nr:hypothetical protein [Candidatus Liminaster caballi]